MARPSPLSKGRVSSRSRSESKQVGRILQFNVQGDPERVFAEFLEQVIERTLSPARLSLLCEVMAISEDRVVELEKLIRSVGPFEV